MKNGPPPFKPFPSTIFKLKQQYLLGHLLYFRLGVAVELFKDFRGRIQQIKTHYLQRLSEVLSITEKRKLTAYHIASEIKWNLPFSSWKEFPPLQKYLAMGETLAYLKILKVKGLIKEVKENGRIFYEVV